jgi:hypothetical protein
MNQEGLQEHLPARDVSASASLSVSKTTARAWGYRRLSIDSAMRWTSTG